MGRIGGLVCFVRDAVPGDRLLIKISTVKRGYAEADIAEIIEASSSRVEPFCRHFGVCGGCNLQHIAPDAQLAMKTEAFLNSLQRIGKIALDQIPDAEVITGPTTGYRNRMRFAIAPGGGWGLRRRASRETLALQECPIAHERIQTALISGIIPKKILGENSDTSPGDSDFTVFADDAGIFFSGETASTKLKGHGFSFPADNFFQSNTEVFSKSLPAICSDIDRGTVADLYGGIGVLAYFSVEMNSEISALSVDSSDSTRIKDNRIAFRKMSVESWVGSSEAKKVYSCIILDPPRTGLSRKVLSYVTDSACSSQIRYMSCNPDTFARDAGSMIRSGMALHKLYIMDFYPHTAHLEVLGVFTRASI